MIVSVGAFLTDQYFEVDRLPLRGESIDAHATSTAPGGKAANQAVAAALLGACVGFVGVVGDDEAGRAGTEALAALGVEVSQVLVTADAPTGHSCIVLDPAGDQIIVNSAGAAAMLSADQAVAAARQLEPSIILLQGEIPSRTSLAVASALPQALVIVDPSPSAAFRSEGFDHVDILTPNITEARDITGLPDPTAADVAAATKVATVLVTRGGAGVDVFAGAHREIIPAAPTSVVDTTGAGDAFNGALATALYAGRTLHEAVEFAVTAASWSVGRKYCIPSFPRREDLSAGELSLGGRH
jgi:ribokinase